MSRVADVDGQYMPHRSAAVHIEDRGYQFADGVYEVLAVVGGQLEARPRCRTVPQKPANPRVADDGIAVITIPDIRWQRCNVKSVALLPNVPGKQLAKDPAAYEAWQIDRQGRVAEGTSTNARIVTDDRSVVTRRPDHAILNGVTRHPVGNGMPGPLSRRLCERYLAHVAASA